MQTIPRLPLPILLAAVATAGAVLVDASCAVCVDTGAAELDAGAPDAGELDAEAGDTGAELGACACATEQPTGRGCPCTPEGAAAVGCGANWIPVCCPAGEPCASPPPDSGPITCGQGIGPAPGWCCSSGAVCAP